MVFGMRPTPISIIGGETEAGICAGMRHLDWVDDN